jgi:hypothetical protein
MTKRYKHSGATGDLIYSLPIVQHSGGGAFYLHLNQMDWIGQHYYGSAPAPFHQGRMTQGDFEYMRSFMEAQPYITYFGVMEPTIEITHNLDRFRPLFVGHPANYLDLYAQVHGVDPELMYTPWITVPCPRTIEGRPIVVNRTARWTGSTPNPVWADLKAQGGEEQAVFVGLPEEYDAFRTATGWDIPHYQTQTMLELAEVIAGAESFVGNQSQAYALAVGLGVNDIILEARVDMPLARNECYFPKFPNIRYV